MKRSFSKMLDGTPEKLIVLWYAEKEHTITAPLSHAPMDTRGSSKRKIFTQDMTMRATSSHGKHISEENTDLQEE